MLFSALPGFAQSFVSAYNVTEPTYLAIDTVGGVKYLYVANHGDSFGTPPANGGTIVKINIATGASTTIATRGTGDGQFISPDAIVVDPATHNLFIADRYLDRVQEIMPDGTFVMKFGSGTAAAADEMHGPVGLARDAAGAIYVSEHGEMNSSVGGDSVSKYTISGTTATRAWRKQNGLNTAYSVAVNGSNLYISDGYNYRVQVWDLNGTPLGSFNTAGSNTIPLGLYFDSTGALWLAESNNAYTTAGTVNQITKLNAPAGTSAGVTFGTQGTGPMQFQLPFDTVIDSATNYAYVADYANNRVQVINLSATPTASVPVINSSASQSGTVGQNFSYQITATNSPTSYAAIDALPAGLTLNTTTGAITGIPSAAATTTTHLTATNASGTSAQFALTITVSAATSSTPTGTAAPAVGPTITQFDLNIPSVVQGVKADMDLVFNTAVTGVDASDFVVTKQGSATISVTGVDAVDASHYKVHFNYTDTDGAIQVGIKTSGTGIVDGSGNAFRGNGYTATPVYGTGTNKAADQAAPQVNVTAGAASGTSVTYTVTFNEPVSGVDASDFMFTGITGTIGTISGSGTTYTVPVTASGSGTMTLTVVGGPTANIRDAATNWFRGEGTASASATIAGSSGGGGTVSAPTITSSATPPAATVGTAYSYQITASGSPTSYSADNLTGTGLSLNATTGLISGTPTTAGTITTHVTATNSGGTSAAVTVTITVNAAAPAGSAPVITSSATPAAATVGTAYSYQITASGSPTSFAADNLTGTGLSLNTATGLISGTPTTAGTITTHVTATNSTGTSAVVTVTITVNAAAPAGSAPVVSSATSASATVGTSFTYQITASGSPTLYAADNLAGTGLSINTATGLISGTPTTAGTITTHVSAMNTYGTSTPVTVTITVAAASTGGNTGGNTGGTIPVVTVQSSVTGTAGIPLSLTATATNNPSSWSLTGAPANVVINATTGVISGTPVSSGIYIASVKATNSSGTGSATVTFSISGSSTGSGNTGGSSGGGSTPPPPPPPVLKGQTVIFNSPVSAILIGQPVKLGATSSSGLPISYQIVSGNASVSGDTLTVTGAGPIVIRALQSGNATYSAASATITVTGQKQAQQIPAPASTTVHTDAGMTFAATSSTGLPITYTVVSGPATISGNTLTFTGTGTVKVSATQAGNSAYDATTSEFTITANPVPRLINISSRLKVSANDANGASIAGFVVTGTESKQILIRAVGPGLTAFGVSSPLANPTLKVFDSKGTVVATNSGWNDDAKITAAGDGVGAFGLTKGSKDAAVLVTLAPGAYTVQVQSANNTGTALIEVYDVSANAAVPTKQLINISTRGSVGSGDDVLVGGFVVSGNETKKVLVRAIGPALTAFNVGGALSDPILTVYQNGKVVATNDSWGTQAAPAVAADITAADTATGAFPLASGSKDAALVLTLQPGVYSAVVTGANGATGAAMVEIYEIPNP